VSRGAGAGGRRTARARLAVTVPAASVLAASVLAASVLAASVLAFTAPAARAQDPREGSSGALVAQALEHEGAGRNREAVVAWRAVIAAGAVAPGVLGLERVFSMLGQEESLLVALDTLLPLHPAERQLRSAQLRTLGTLGRDAAAAAAFRAWRDLAPREVAPYREYARVLLFNNRASAADTVLREAEAALGTTRALTLEVAQMRAALGLWKEAAAAWREAMRQEQYFESAAVFSLTPTPADDREAVRAALSAEAPPLGAAHALALLEVAWGAPRSGWQVLRALPASDTAVAIWREFAVEVERAQAWGTARDALAAIHAARPDAEVALRVARAALRADDAATALRFARDAGERLSPDEARRDALPLELDALARLGRATEAEDVLARARAVIGGEAARGFARTIAWAWIRAGDVARARAALRDAPLDAEDAVAGWLALFEGDLDGARTALRHTDAPGQDAITALALLNRTRQPRAPAVGAAFLALARTDSARAARGFESAARDLPEAAPLLLALAARIETARGDDARALGLWTRVAEEYAEAPEAAEAYLEWSRGLRRRGDVPGARQRLEHLILTYPSSALVPQARRELDALRPGAAAGAS
jgi:hypothetical protein